MNANFTIQQVSIEGFKGFTNRQVIDLNGNHLFLLGKNGNGKSSILEAIRWGLFGSTGRRNEVVANSDYSGSCRVEITIDRNGKKWSLRRTALKGSTGGNDSVLTDENGNEHSIRDVMPQFDSVEAGEGMHIVFSSQTQYLRRRSEDLSDFERTVFYHIGLAHPRSLLSQLEEYIDDQHASEEYFGNEISEISDEIDEKVAYFNKQRGNILQNPPWEGDFLPTLMNTEEKIRTLMVDISGQPFDSEYDGYSLEGLIEEVENQLEKNRDQDQSTLESDLIDLQQRVNSLASLKDTFKEIQSLESEKQDKQSQLSIILSEGTIDDLKQTVLSLRDQIDVEDLRLSIIQNTVTLIGKTDIATFVCPVCNIEHNKEELHQKLCENKEQIGKTPKELETVEEKIELTEHLTTNIEECNARIHELLHEALEPFNELINQIDINDVLSQDQIDMIEIKLKQTQEKVDLTQSQIENGERWYNSFKAKLTDCKEEVKFHDIQKKLVKLEKSRNQITQIQKAYDDFVSFGETIQTIMSKVSSRLNAQLIEKIPSVAEKLSQVFAALTQHPWYDRLIIAQDKLPKLELQIASSHDSFERGYSPEVLNGQAESALALVPYFTFSQTDDALTEVYLVLLDDPTRAFDEDHISILVERLAELGNYIQLVVASQETSRIRHLLPDKFSNEYQIVEPTDWSHDDGPVLKIG